MRFLRQQQRRVRFRSVLLASYRRDDREWGRWLQWEILKPLVPLALATLLHMVQWISIPHTLYILMMLACFCWMGFVAWNAWSAFQRLDKRRLALLNASGVDCDLGKTIGNRRAWSEARTGKTMREILDGPHLIERISARATPVRCLNNLTPSAAACGS